MISEEHEYKLGSRGSESASTFNLGYTQRGHFKVMKVNVAHSILTVACYCMLTSDDLDHQEY